MKLYFITGNKNKFEEIKEVLPYIEKLDIDIAEVQGIDARRIIEKKLQTALAEKKACEFIVEDTSLYLDCLKGLPGPLIKWFLETMGPEGLFEIADKFKNYSATAKTIIGFAGTQGDIHYFEGEIKGRLSPPAGKTGFGWDVVFIPNGHDKTFAQMGRLEKNKISMRKIATQKLKDFLGKR